MSNKLTNAIAFILLSTMLITAFSSSLGDSLTMDELSHIPAGYSYVSQQDFRINPEHPPLIKDLAGFPLLFLNLNFPSDSDAWQNKINGQWDYGWELMYNSGNNPDQIIFWARLPMLFVLLALGLFLFWWTKKEFGNKAALIVLALFSFSPTFLAHGRLVTTDVGAALGFLLGTYFWLKFLRKPSKKNVLLAGVMFGIAMLFKFSVVLLLPLYVIITIVYSLLKKENIFKYLALSVLAGIIGTVLVILPVYYLHTLNYPPERQLADTVDILQSSQFTALKKLDVWMADKPVIRSLGHYFLGLLMATQRTASGNTVYFLGNVSAAGWSYYFPIAYLLKMPLAFHVITVMTLALIFWALIKTPFWKNIFAKTKQCILDNFALFSMAVFIIIYWTTSVTGNLNIGVRHVLPVFPFTYVLIVAGLLFGIEKIKNFNIKKALYALIIMLLAWYAYSSISTYPYYLSYFNELAGGKDNGYKFIVDSNYDWGQDLKRLKMWLEENSVDKIKVAYFGGGDLNHYLGNKWEGFHPWDGKEQKGWVAISATLLQEGRGVAVHNFDGSTTHYMWLNDYEPVARAGKSIFIFYID
jgi:hypothetical protein